ncbi:hypothetical protein RU639_010507 [Aspergillus parasiticus]
MAPKLSLTSTKNILSGTKTSTIFYLYQVRGAIAESVTEKALKVGFRHIDSAEVYGNERESVSAVEKARLKRSEVFLTTKVLPQAMGKNGLFDLNLLHAPFGEELEEYIKSGDVGRIEVGQYELHPWLGRADLVDWLHKRGVVIEAYSPLARGTRMDEPVLRAISEKHKKSPAQILIRWSLQKGFVPLPKSATPERILENANVFDFELDEDDMQSLHTDEYAPSTWDPTVQQD